jgi:hypothetical protein
MLQGIRHQQNENTKPRTIVCGAFSFRVPRGGTSGPGELPQPADSPQGPPTGSQGKQKRGFTTETHVGGGWEKMMEADGRGGDGKGERRNGQACDWSASRGARSGSTPMWGDRSPWAWTPAPSERPDRPCRGLGRCFLEPHPCGIAPKGPTRRTLVRPLIPQGGHESPAPPAGKPVACWLRV